MGLASNEGLGFTELSDGAPLVFWCCHQRNRVNSTAWFAESKCKSFSCILLHQRLKLACLGACDLSAFDFYDLVARLYACSCCWATWNDRFYRYSLQSWVEKKPFTVNIDCESESAWLRLVLSLYGNRGRKENCKG